MNLLLSTSFAGVKIPDWLTDLGSPYEFILTIILVITMLVILVATVMIDRSLKSILRFTFPEAAQEYARKKASKLTLSERLSNLWTKMLQLKPLEQEKDMVIDHEYDGIKELDNPVPMWFNVLFYSTVTFGLCYLLIYHVFEIGMTQTQEYEHEMAQAEIAKQEYLAQAANLIDESSIEIDASMIAAGRSIFSANCSACHGGAGEGGIGPNLTDNYWLHGGDIKEIFKTVKYGVPAKGMVPWEQTLTPGQIAEVSNYIMSIRNSNPPNPKAPEGTELVAQTEEQEATIE